MPLLRSRRRLHSPLRVLELARRSLLELADLVDAAAHVAGDRRWEDAAARLRDAADRLRL